MKRYTFDFVFPFLIVGQKYVDMNTQVLQTNAENGAIGNGQAYRPYIIADDREREVIAALAKHPADVVPQRLDVADFLVSAECAVERKRGDDLVSSIKDGRFRDELTRLTETFEKPVMVIEDFGRAFYAGNFNPASIYGALGSAALRFGIPIIPSRHAEDTALLLYRLAIREQVERKSVPEARSAPKKLSPEERKAYFLEGFFHTGPEKAKQLLDHFGSPGAVIDALRSTEVKTTKAGKPKLGASAFEALKGFGIKWVADNLALLGGK